MNQSNKNIPLSFRLSQGIGIFFLFIASCAGILYMFRGNFAFSAIFLIVGLLSLFLVVEQLWKLKTKAKNDGFGIKEIFFLLIYILIAGCSFLWIFHGYNLEYETKSEIVSTGEQYRKELLVTLPNEYNIKAEGEITSFGLDNPKKDTIALEQDKKEVRRGFESKQSKIKRSDSLYIEQYVRSIINWNRLELQQSFYELDKILDKHIRDYKEGFGSVSYKISDEETWKPDPFEYTRKTITGDVISDPFELKDRYSVSYLIPFLIWLAGHAMILLPYILSNRGLIAIEEATYTD